MTQHQTGRWLVAGLAILLGALYIINPGAGVFELIPDNMPLVGNLDEAAATALLLWGLHTLRQNRREPHQAEEPRVVSPPDQSG